MKTHSERFDAWIRSEFIDINTELEELYFAQADRAAIAPAGAELREALGGVPQGPKCDEERDEA